MVSPKLRRSSRKRTPSQHFSPPKPKKSAKKRKTTTSGEGKPPRASSQRIVVSKAASGKSKSSITVTTKRGLQSGLYTSELKQLNAVLRRNRKNPDKKQASFISHVRQGHNIEVKNYVFSRVAHEDFGLALDESVIDKQGRPIVPIDCDLFLDDRRFAKVVDAILLDNWKEVSRIVTTIPKQNGVKSLRQIVRNTYVFPAHALNSYAFDDKFDQIKSQFNDAASCTKAPPALGGGHATTTSSPRNPVGSGGNKVAASFNKAPPALGGGHATTTSGPLTKVGSGGNNVAASSMTAASIVTTRDKAPPAFGGAARALTTNKAAYSFGATMPSEEVGGLEGVASDGKVSTPSKYDADVASPDSHGIYKVLLGEIRGEIRSGFHSLGEKTDITNQNVTTLTIAQQHIQAQVNGQNDKIGNLEATVTVLQSDMKEYDSAMKEMSESVRKLQRQERLGDTVSSGEMVATARNLDMDFFSADEESVSQDDQDDCSSSSFEETSSEDGDPHSPTKTSGWSVWGLFSS